MQRVRDERGAVAVFVALIMVVLVGFAAIAVDVSAMWAEKRELQNGADAGALAIAQACANDPASCTMSMASSTATSYAVANRNGGNPTASIVSLTSGQVTVSTSDPHENWFATIFGSNESAVSARATAAWGGPNGGGTFPLAFSVCEWAAQAGSPGGLESTNQLRIALTKTSTSTCNGPSGNVVPGGFGWVDATAGTCTTASMINGWIYSSTGNTPPNGCDPEDFEALVGQTVLIPIFDEYTGTGNNAGYHVHGYAAFEFTGYYFSGQYKNWPPAPLGDCSGNERCIAGYFTREVELNEVLTTDGGGPQLGLSIVSLIE